MLQKDQEAFATEPPAAARLGWVGAPGSYRCTDQCGPWGSHRVGTQHPNARALRGDGGRGYMRWDVGA